VRFGLLLRSGHSYLSRAPEFVVASVVVAAVGALALGFRGRGNTSAVLSIRRSAVTLGLIQAGAFVALEASERIVAHASAERLLQLTLVGVALQIGVAFVAAIALRLLARLGHKLAVVLAVRRAQVAAPVRVQAVSRTRTVRAYDVCSSVRGRAPPLSIAS
jgi:hypothetical protein